MTSAIHKSIAWLLIAELAILAGGADWLHWIPGCGHGVPVGDGIVLLGIRVEHNPWATVDRPHVHRPHGQDIPIYSEDECAICSAAAQKCMSDGFVAFILVMPLVHDLPAVAVCDMPALTPRPFQARAPPCV